MTLAPGRDDRGHARARDDPRGADLRGHAARADAARGAPGDRRGFPLDVAHHRYPHAVRVAHALDIREDDQRIGRDQVADQRRELVVIAEPDLLGCDRVVLVDDRHAAVIEERAQREPRREEAPAIAEVVVGEQHLPDLDAVRTERVLPVLHQPRLPDRGRGLQARQLGRASRELEPRHAERDRTRRHDHDLDAALAEREHLVRDHGRAARRCFGDQPAAALDDDPLGGCERGALGDHLRTAWRARQRVSSASIAPSR